VRLSDEFALLRLRVVADADAGALARVLERFQYLNAVPRKVLAEPSKRGVFHIEIDIMGVTPHCMDIIAAKISEAPCIHSARWHPLF
jgi:hypothetical protein